MISEADLLLIEQYLEGTLTEDQINQVDERMNKDPEFATHLALVKEMPSAILTDTGTFRNQMHRIMEEDGIKSPHKTASIKRIAPRFILLAVAAILAGIVLAVNIFLPVKKVDLYGMNFSIPNENLTTRDNSILDANLQKAVQAYSNHNFQSAIPLFQKYLQSNESNSEVRFFLAISLMAEGKFEDALANLGDLSNHTGPYQNASLWYSALASIKLNEKNLAQSFLTKLVEKENSYTPKAKELLEELSN